MAYVRQVINILKNGGTEGGIQAIKQNIFANDTDRTNYFNRLKSADSSFGKIIDFTPAGFKFNTATNGTHYLHISGNLKRGIRDTQFSVDINPGVGKDEMYVFGYDY